eukprot:2670936-Rhodomonas_salina.2
MLASPQERMIEAAKSNENPRGIHFEVGDMAEVSSLLVKAFNRSFVKSHQRRVISSTSVPLRRSVYGMSAMLLCCSYALTTRCPVHSL